MARVFDPEWKIKWEELSPSLQERFHHIWRVIASLETSEQYGLDGQVLKIDHINKEVFPDDNIREIKAVDSMEDFEEEKTFLPIDLEDVFKTWEKVSFYSNTWNGNDATSLERNKYLFSSKYNAIVNPLNSNSNNAFISINPYAPGFTITIRITRDAALYSEVGAKVDNDDDLLYFVAGAIKNSDGSWDDISVMRAGGGSDNWSPRFAIRLNTMSYGTTGSIVLAKLAVDVPRRLWINGECFLKITKSNGVLEAWTSDIDPSVTDVDQSTRIEYRLPATCPSGMTTAQYTRLRQLMTTETKIGFGTYSNAGAFMIKEQRYLFEDSKIYNFNDGNVYEYDRTTGTWKVSSGTMDSYIPGRTFIYNSRLKKLWFYYYPGKATLLSTNSVESEKLVANFKDIFTNGLDGQVIKVGVDKSTSKPTLFADDDFRNILTVDNDKDLAEMLSFTPVSLKDVFNGWYRFVHTCKSVLEQFSTPVGEANYPLKDGTVDWQNQPASNLSNGVDYFKQWSFDESTNSITKTIDWSPVCGFVSPEDKQFTNYYLRAKVTVADEDTFGLIAGFMKDSSGKEHTLMAMRWAYNGKGGGGDGHWRWILIYDMGNPTQHIIIDKSDQFNQAQQITGTMYVSMRRTGNIFQFKTTDVNVATDDEKYTMDFIYPDTLAEAKSKYGMADAEYYNIGTMLEKTSRLGFSAFAMALTFYIDTQYEIFDDAKIYALHTNYVYENDSATHTWKNIGKVSDMLPNRIFLYNYKLDKFWFYYYRGKYVEISPYKKVINNILGDDDGTGGYPAQSGHDYGYGRLSGMVKRYDKELNTTYWEDYFYMIRVTTDTNQTTQAKDLNIDLQDVIKNWEQYMIGGGSYYKYGSGSPSYDSALNAYGYSQQYSAICNSSNSDPTSVFISNREFDNNFMIKIKLIRDMNAYNTAINKLGQSVTSIPHNMYLDDDDPIIFCAGILKNADGTLSDISIVRTGHKSSTPWAYNDTKAYASFFIAYNGLNLIGSYVSMPVDGILARASYTPRDWTEGNCFIKVEKTPGKIVAWTSDIANVTDVDPSMKLEFTLPDTKPSTWSDKMWNDLNALLKTKSSLVGFATRSNCAIFQIVDQKYLFDDKVFDLSTNTLWQYTDGTWVIKGKISDFIPPRSLLYNKYTKKLYWYLSPSDYHEIVLA